MYDTCADPNGPMVYKGLYHLFYQYNPNGASFGNISWGHSTSKDLVNWRAHSLALSPSQPYDINGAWSGSATILRNGEPALLYTGNDSRNRQVQNLAVPKNPSDPYLKEWVKSPRNPLISPNSFNMINATSFRDPTTAWIGLDGDWRIVIGSKVERRGLAILYRSKDFVDWVKAEHPLHSAEGTGMWECPDFYPVSAGIPTGLDTSLSGSGIKHVLKVSLDKSKHDYYTIGTYDRVEDKYIPDTGSVDNGSGLRYDYGKFYASKTFYDSLKKRRILWGWINESLPQTEYVKQGWSGVQGIPRIVWLDEPGKQLLQWPIKEIKKLRSERVEIPSTMLETGSVAEVSGISAAQADVVVKFKIMEFEKAEKMEEGWTDPQELCSQKGASVRGGIGPFGLKVLASENMEEYTAVFFRVFKGNNNNPVVLMSSLNKKTDKTSYGAFVDVNPMQKELSLRILIDHSIVESFGAKGKVCITSRVYPTEAIELLNVKEHSFIILCHKIDSNSFPPKPSTPTNSMEIVLGLGGQIVVDHKRDLLNVYTSSQQISGDENPRGPRAKLTHDYGLVQITECLEFPVLLLNIHIKLFDTLKSQFIAFHQDPHRLVHELPSDFEGFWGHCCRKNSNLNLGRQQLEDIIDLQGGVIAFATYQRHDQVPTPKLGIELGHSPAAAIFPSKR
nr:beta-fructofuranosidase, insoluble isoenzyme CWINV1-like [Ipomoea batatas]